MVGAAVAGAVTLAIVARVATLVDDWGRDWTNNHAEWEESAKDPAMRPLELSQPVSQVRQRIEEWLDEESAWQLESVEEGADSQLMHLTRRTAIMRFVDDIHVRLTEVTNADGSVITRVDAESQSRVGKGDLGQNPRNLKHFREAFEGMD